MKIAIVGTLPPIKGGISNHCYNQAKSLANYADVDFINFRSPYPKRFYRGEVDNREAKNYDYGKINKIDIIKWYNPLTWILAPLKTDAKILIVNWWDYRLFPVIFMFLLISKICGKSIILSVHNVVGYETNFLDKTLREIIFSIPKIFFVHSKENKTILSKKFHIDTKRVFVIPMGITSVGKKLEKNYARSVLKLEKNSRIILFFGQIREYKGIDDLIVAFRIVKSEIKNSKLLIVGKNWISWKYYGNLIKRYKLTDDIVLRLEFIPDEEIKLYMSACDVVVLPYRHFDAQSAIGTIALAHGKPMIVTNTGGLSDFSMSKKLVAKQSNPSDLARKIVYVLKNEKLMKKMSEYSLKLAKENKWDSIALKTVNLCKTLFKLS